MGMIHGDLKGVHFRSLESLDCFNELVVQSNILVDEPGYARLADFCLLAVISDPANLLSSSSNARGGTVRWMSPELIYPEEFGFKKSLPTKSSDCYALAMVIYEVIGGNLPFHGYSDSQVALKVVAGEHPPQGVAFTHTMWETLELCWTSRPNDRPSIEYVLRCLEDACDGGNLMHRSSGIETWANHCPVIRSTSASPPPISSVSQPLIVKSISDADGRQPGRDIHPNLLTPRVDLGTEGTYQVSTT